MAIINGTFDTDLSGWTVQPNGGTVSWDNGRALLYFPSPYNYGSTWPTIYQDITIDTPILSFDYSMASYPVLYWEVYINGVLTISDSRDWNQPSGTVSINVSAYIGQSARILFKANRPAGFADGYVWIDNVVLLRLGLITISPSATTIYVSGNIQITSECKDERGDIIVCPTLIWTSDNLSVATIDQSGLVTAVSQGTANITATYQGLTSNTSTINVEIPVLSSITISPNSLNLFQYRTGNTGQLVATCIDQYGSTVTCSSIVWSSDNLPVATVNNSGKVTAISQGTANITAAAQGLTSNLSTIYVTIPNLQKIDALTLDTGENGLMSAIIDINNAYFGTSDSPGKVIKIDLPNFTKLPSLVLNPGEDDLMSAVIDQTTEFGYFGTNTYPGNIIKVSLSNLARIDSVITDQAYYLSSGVIDPVNSYAYFGMGGRYTAGTGSLIAKIGLSPFSYVGRIVWEHEPNAILRSAIIDQIKGYTYFGTNTIWFDGNISKINLSNFTLENVLGLNAGESVLRCAVIDQANGFAYFGAITGQIVKIDLSNFTETASLNPGVGGYSSASISPERGFAYFGTYTSPGVITKVRLSDFTVAQNLILDTGDDNLASSVIDIPRATIYYGTETSPGKIIKLYDQDLIPPKILTSIEISPSSTDIIIGGTKQFIAICKDQNNVEMTCPTITWNITDPTKGNISNTGLFTGNNVGSTTITATGDGIVSFATINITPITTPPITPPIPKEYPENVFTAGMFMFLLLSKRCEDYHNKSDCEEAKCEWKFKEKKCVNK